MQRVEREMKAHGIDPATLLGCFALWHALRFVRRIVRLERRADDLAKRVDALEAAAAEAKAALHAVDAGAKKAEAGATAAWNDVGKAIKLW